MKISSIALIAVSSLLLTACLPETPTPKTTWYVDADSDGYGDGNDTGTASTTQPSGYVANNSDCDDDNPAINPDAVEVPNDGIDQDCESGDLLQYSVGETGPAGGVVFYITNGGASGFEAAPVDQNTGVGNGVGSEWGCYASEISGADDTAIGTGSQNTTDMLTANCSPHTGGNSLAADLANAYSLNGYDDWFLPSRDELNALYLQRVTVGGFVSSYYWSSTESSAGNAWFHNFDTGIQVSGWTKFQPLGVRVIRAF